MQQAGAWSRPRPTAQRAWCLPFYVYYRDHCPGSNDAGITTFLLTAAAIGGLIKHNASISGAEAGCQAEVGSAAAMAGRRDYAQL